MEHERYDKSSLTIADSWLVAANLILLHCNGQLIISLMLSRSFFFTQQVVIKRASSVQDNLFFDVAHPPIGVN